jgi:hypothetical protein
MGNFRIIVKHLFIIIFLLSNIIYAQIDSLENKNDDLIQDILDESQTDATDEGVIDLIEELRANPVDLNKTDLTELQKIPGLSFSDASAIINYRNKHGKFFSVGEMHLAGISQKVFENISPFLAVNFSNIIKTKQNKFISHLELRNRIITDLQKDEGFIDHKFAGNNLHTYTRLKAEFGETVKAGFLLDKDPGEKYYNDLTSGYISTKGMGIFNKIILGDYSVQFGQGLSIWSAYSFSKSSNAIYPVKKNPNYLKEYSSSDENRFLRGISSQLGFGAFSLTTFFSQNKFDASLDPLNSEIVSTPLDGLHRTNNEINKKNSSSEKILGAILDFTKKDKYHFGFLYYNSTFKNNFEMGNIYDLSGNSFHNYSISYDIYIGKINLSGEHSFNEKSLASIINIEFAFSKRITFITSLRNYPRNYYNLHSRGIGESSNTQNEFGIYNGIRWRTDPGIFNFYFDQFKFPFSTYYNPLPSSGNELSLDFLSSKFSNSRIHFRIKHENKETGVDYNGSIKLFKRIKSTARLELIYYPDKRTRLKTRLELSRYRIKAINQKEDGLLIFQDARFNIQNNIDFSGRIIFFRTDSFNTAIYEFENDLDGMFSLYGLYKEGIRWYTMVKINLPWHLLFSIKYSETYKPEEMALGSGYSKISGNLDNRVSIQLELNI